ncbi:hypothetical protein JG688_00010921 [Phytophthora aleatoria]|uniref:Alkyl transferase n=1 Tax=Phytophthora aleatoria TaxID=2496075 RepID=A0A8J5MEX6_9STRA|nr:hypothetical protein JG688_00010921 [Phytophthora aleatoria]
MEENASGVIWPRESLGRQTLSQLEDASRDLGLAKNFYNGFEMWWLAGMPIMLVFVLTLLSFSLASGVSGLGKSVPWHKVLPAPVWYLVGWLGRLLNADCARLERKTTITAMLRDSGELKIPRHIAVIMDGNRRYGKTKYGAGVRGHTDGSKTLVNFTDWDVRVRVLVSDGRKLPPYIVEAIEEIETKSQNCSKFSLNLCVSYGSRDEIVGACRKIATEVAKGETSIEDIDEDLLSQRMLTAGLPDPDILIRTSGELRISNFLLFQIAYSELIFMDKMWPEVTKDDVQGIIIEFNRRKRRFGK